MEKIARKREKNDEERLLRQRGEKQQKHAQCKAKTGGHQESHFLLLGGSSISGGYSWAPLLTRELCFRGGVRELPGPNQEKAAYLVEKK